MTVRCKFKCESIEVTGEQKNIILRAVTNGSPENESFFKYTPSGTLSFGCVNERASSQFEVGKEYYIDISLAG